MADVNQLKALVDLYGVGVRAGLITPQKDDEVYFRKLIDLPQMSASNSAYWDFVGGLKHPITIKQELEETQAQQVADEN